MWYNLRMDTDLGKYRGMRICAAVSGGRDSMALLHYLHARAAEYGITLTALNCDHKMRGETSARDSAFVADFCKKLGVPLSRYSARAKLRDEGEARAWRLECYLAEAGACDCVATAHHLDDNAETVLFNLARGSGLAGMRGITDTEITVNGKRLALIRPLIACTRAEIDEYIAANGIPYVDDETNFSNVYTRNRIRHNVLPELEDAVPGAARSIYRFSRIAAEEDDCLERQAEKLVAPRGDCGIFVSECTERAIFRRAARRAVARIYERKDYTSAHFEKLYALLSAGTGKKFRFLGLTAFRQEGGLLIVPDELLAEERREMPFAEFVSGRANAFGSAPVSVRPPDAAESRAAETGRATGARTLKTLHFDADKVPESAVVRFRRAGDRFEKFGGGTKKLGDWFTDKKVPAALRGRIPLLCDGGNVLMVFGMEISESIKTDKNTKHTLCAIAEDCTKN